MCDVSGPNLPFEDGFRICRTLLPYTHGGSPPVELTQTQVCRSSSDLP